MFDRATSPFDDLDLLVFAGVALAFFMFWFLGRVDNAKHPRRFAKLAGTLGATVTKVDEFDSYFEAAEGDRLFKIRQALISRSTGGRSSSSWKLIVSTPLNKRWEYHDVKVQTLGRLGGWIVNRMLGNRTPTAPAKQDASARRVGVLDDFGARFSIQEQGTLPAGWMSESSRVAIRALYEDQALKKLSDGATLEAGEGRLQLTIAEPNALPADEIRAMLKRLADIANAFTADAQRLDRFI